MITPPLFLLLPLLFVVTMMVVRQRVSVESYELRRGRQRGLPRGGLGDGGGGFGLVVAAV